MKTLAELLNNKISEDKFLFEMAKVGTFYKDKYEVWVRSNDQGNIPHFHIWDNSTNGKEFHTCVQFETNKYFHHTGKEGVFNSKERKALNDYLQHKDTFLGKTIWEILIWLWNNNNSSKKLSEKLKQPDYTTIKNN